MAGYGYFSASNVALIGILCALWAVLNLTMGPLSFRLLGLPVIHDFAAFFTLLLTAWAIGKFGACTLVGGFGTALALLFGSPIQILGFAASALSFDVIMAISRHSMSNRLRDYAVAALATLAAAYLAGVIIGILFMNGSVQWALTVWGGWHVIGGVLSVMITLPILAILEKSNVKALLGKRGTRDSSNN